MDPISLEHVQKDDVDRVLIPTLQILEYNGHEDFKWLSHPLTLKTSNAFGVKMDVSFSDVAQRTQILLEIPDTLQEYIKRLDHLFSDTLGVKASHPLMDYRPFCRDGYKSVYCKLQREGGVPIIDMVNRDNVCTRVRGHKNIFQALHGKEMVVKMVFEVPWLHRHGNVIGSNLRLVRIECTL